MYAPGQWRLRRTKQSRGSMMRPLMLVLASAVMVACGIVALADLGTATSTPAAVIVLDAEEQEFLTLINGYRADLGLPNLAVDPQLQAAARWMSEDMAANDYFSHYDSLGRDPFQRMDAFGYTYNVWKGENLAAGTADAQVAFDLWKASPGHNSNMTNQQFQGIGIARAYGPTSGLSWYWTTDFGGIANPDAPAAPTASPAPSVAPLMPTPTHTPAASPTGTPPASQGTPAPTPIGTSSPEPIDSAVPTPTPTSTPSPQPPQTDSALHGDTDCDGTIDAKDALAVLRSVASISGAGCSPAATDVNCSGAAETTDALAILRYVADVPFAANGSCPQVGSVVS